MRYYYLKEEGKTTKTVLDKEIDRKPKAFQANRVPGLDILADTKVKSSSEMSNMTKTLLKHMKNEDYDSYYNSLIEMMERIINIKTMDDLLGLDDNSLISIFINKYSSIMKMAKTGNGFYAKIVEQLKEIRSKRSMEFSNILFKDIVRKYIYEYYQHLTEEDLLKIMDELEVGDDILDHVLLNNEPMSKIEDNELKNLIKKISLSIIESETSPLNKKHLCFDCPVPLKDCPKIMDYYENRIDKYDFITDGVQQTHEEAPSVQEEVFYDGNIEVTDLFIVTGCRKFNDAKKKVLGKKGK